MASNTATRKSMNGLLNTPTDSENINITQNLDMNSFKIVDLGAGTDATDAVNLGQIAGIATNTAKIAVIDNSITLLDASVSAFNLTSVEASLNFLDLSGIQFSLAIDDIETSCNIYEASINAISFTNIESSLNFLELSGAVFAVDIATIDNSCNIYEASINAISFTNIENSLNFLELSGAVFALDIATIDNSCNIYEASINALETGGGTELWTGTSDICYNAGNVGIGSANPLYKLSVKGAGGNVLKLEADNHAYMGFFPKGDICGNDRYSWFGYGSNSDASSGILSINLERGFTPMLEISGNVRIKRDAFFGLNPLDRFSANGEFMPYNGLVWRNHTSFIYGQTLQISGYGGVRFFTLGTERFHLNYNNTWNLQSPSASVGYVTMGEVRNLTYDALINGYYTGIRFLQISSNSNTSANQHFALGLEAINNANLKGQLTLNPYGGSVAIGYDFYLTPNRKLFINGDVYANGSYQRSSDDRIKYNETPIGSALPIINKLKTYKYEKITSSKKHNGIWIPSDASWNEVKNDVDLSGNRLYEYNEEIGFIAQDIRNEINDLSFCVSGEEVDASGNQTILGVNYNDIFCLAIQAIQELDAKRKDDNKKFIDLNKRLLILEEKLKNIESSEKEYIL